MSLSGDKKQVSVGSLHSFSEHSQTALSNGKMPKSGGISRKPKMANTWPEMFAAWPKSTALIVANEFFQKFSALSTVLTLYMLNGLKFTARETTLAFTAYSILGGFAPLFGSIIADGYIGKFKTILYASIIYSVGKIVLACASMMNYRSVIHPWLDAFGIMIIIVGMGGITPCVASFGGDQFAPHQERMISVFFSIFYASINSGALISTIILPILRSQSCLGEDSCYPLSFGVSAILMIFAAVLFVVGSKWYKKQPPQGNVFALVYKIVKTSSNNRSHALVKNRAHWLDYYMDTHNCVMDEKCVLLQKKKRDSTQCDKKVFIEDIKSLWRIVVMFLPIPMFWALYDQQYSVWLIQAIQMDCRVWGDWLLLPDQMQFINPVLILVFIAIFESIVYPIVSYFVKLTPLRKMVAGGVLASIAFVVSAAVQMKVNTTMPELPEPGKAFVSFMNTFDDCTINATLLQPAGLPRFTAQIPSNTSLTNNRALNQTQLFEVAAGKVSFSLTYNGSDCDTSKQLDLPSLVTYMVDNETIYYIYVGQMGAFIAKTDPKKPTGGTGEFSIGITLALTGEFYKGNMALCRNNTPGSTPNHPCDPGKGEDFYYFQTDYDQGTSSDLLGYTNYTRKVDEQYSKLKATVYNFKAVRPGNWMLYYMENTPRTMGQKSMSKEEVKVSPTGLGIEMEGQGGVYVLLLTGTKQQPQKRIFQVVPDNTVSILWQIPQIAIITAAEILFSITGYEFSYSQSVPSMKAVVQALWMCTVAGGDILIIIMVLIDFKDLALLSLVYAAMMLLVIFVFALLAVFYYEYRDTPLNQDNENNYGDEDDWTLDKDQQYGPQIDESGLNNIGFLKDIDDWSAKFSG